MPNEQQTFKEVQIVPAQQSYAENIIAQGIEKGVPVETMEKLMAMRRELKAEAAKEAYDEAMAAFQGECPTIKKQKAGGKTKSGQVAYMYAPLEMIVEQVKELIQKHGFSYQIETEVPEGKVKVTCTVKHKAGHSERSTMEVPLGTRTEIMSAPQAVAATVTFAKRYAFSNAFGIMTGDVDTDRQKDKADKELATPEQVDEIDRLAVLAKMTKADVVQRCRELYGVSFTTITPVQAEGIIAGLKKRINQKV